MQQIPFLLLLAFLAAAPATAKVRIIATTTDLAAIARAVGGNHVSAESLTRGTRDPHFAAAKPSMIRRLYRADLLLVVGADMEVAWLPAALRASRNPRAQPGLPGYLNLSESVPLLNVASGPVNRAMGDVHAKGNPHYLLDPRNGGRAAAAIAARLARIDPGNRPVFEANLATFQRRLDGRFAAWRETTKPLRGKSVISYHKTFPYLADAFGFRIVTQVEPLPGISPTASRLAELVGRIRSEKIGLLVMAPYYERRSARFLAERTGIKIAVLPQAVGAEPEIRTYFDLFDAIAATLAKAGAT